MLSLVSIARKAASKVHNQRIVSSWHNKKYGAVNVSATRIPVRAFGCSLVLASALKLSIIPAYAATERIGIPHLNVGEILLGNIVSVNFGHSCARQVQLTAGTLISADAIDGARFRGFKFGATKLIEGISRFFLKQKVLSLLGFSSPQHSPPRTRSVNMSKHEYVIAFDCGGIFANDIPVDMFKKLAKDCYPEEEQARIADIHARNRDLWNRFKQEDGFTEQTYFETVIEREKLNESVAELKQRLRHSIVCYQHVREVAVELFKQGYTLAIMSNHSNEWFEYIATTFKFAEFCPPNRTIVSQAVLCSKPSVAIMDKLYEAITKELGPHEKSKIVFVDDTEANVKAAISYGFKSFVYDARLQDAEALWASLAEYGVKRS